MYSDKLSTKAPDLEAATKSHNSIIEVLSQAVFDIRQWLYDNRGVVEKLPANFLRKSHCDANLKHQLQYCFFYCLCGT